MTGAACTTNKCVKCEVPVHSGSDDNHQYQDDYCCSQEPHEGDGCWDGNLATLGRDGDPHALDLSNDPKPV